MTKNTMKDVISMFYANMNYYYQITGPMHNHKTFLQQVDQLTGMRKNMTTLKEDMAKVKSDLVLLEENIHNTAKDYFNANDKHIDMDAGQKATMFDDAMIEFKRSIKLAKSKFGIIDTKMDDIK